MAAVTLQTGQYLIASSYLVANSVEADTSQSRWKVILIFETEGDTLGRHSRASTVIFRTVSVRRSTAKQYLIYGEKTGNLSNWKIPIK
jgi:hypothetical protein